ncbi:hypothetical protein CAUPRSCDRAFT_12270, partial [Caulochytrium protostelioides]
ALAPTTDEPTTDDLCVAVADPARPPCETPNHHNAKRSVTFGPQLHPEIFDYEAPVNSPLRRGVRTPVQALTCRPGDKRLTPLRSALRQGFRSVGAVPHSMKVHPRQSSPLLRRLPSLDRLTHTSLSASAAASASALASATAAAVPMALLNRGLSPTTAAITTPLMASSALLTPNGRLMGMPSTPTTSAAAAATTTTTPATTLTLSGSPAALDAEGGSDEMEADVTQSAEVQHRLEQVFEAMRDDVAKRQNAVDRNDPPPLLMDADAMAVMDAAMGDDAGSENDDEVAPQDILTRVLSQPSGEQEAASTPRHAVPPVTPNLSAKSARHLAKFKSPSAQFADLKALLQSPPPPPLGTRLAHVQTALLSADASSPEEAAATVAPAAPPASSAWTGTTLSEVQSSGLRMLLASSAASALTLAQREGLEALLQPASQTTTAASTPRRAPTTPRDALASSFAVPIPSDASPPSPPSPASIASSASSAAGDDSDEAVMAEAPGTNDYDDAMESTALGTTLHEA